MDDRRGQRMPIPGGMRTGGIGCVGLLVIVVLAMIFGVDPMALLQETSVTTGVPQQAPMPAPSSPEEDVLADFVAVVLADTEDTWKAIFAQNGATYREPTLVLYTGYVQSACGLGQAATGPFYCPGDQKVYVDLGFYDELRNRFQAPGDFAQAYVIAHEIGHHVQTLLGITQHVDDLRRSSSQAAANELSVRLELQADCLAGVWAHHADRTRGVLEAGDIEEGLNAAAAIGDDHIQRQTRGMVVPDSFTHGSSEQRVRWFRRGLETGDPDACETFEVAHP